MDIEVEGGGILGQNSTYTYDDNYVYQDEPESKGSAAVAIPVLYTLVLVVGLFGNGFLLALMAMKRRSWSQSDTFILHLSVTDILLLLTLPLWAAQAAQLRGWCFGPFLCKFSGAVFHINFYCGIFLLVCISLDRYLSIIHSTQLFSQKRPKLVHISCLCVWIISLLLSIPDWIFMVTQKKTEQEKTLCVHDYSVSVPGTYMKLVSRLVHHSLGFLLPTAALVICGCCVLLQLQQSSKPLQTQRAFFMVILPLVGVFFLCWMPYNIALIVDTVRTSSDEALIVTKALGCIHACLRPLLYIGLCRNFRGQVLTVLRCAKFEDDGSLWELGVGAERPPDRSHDDEAERKQMMSGDHQVQSTQC